MKSLLWSLFVFTFGLFGGRYTDIFWQAIAGIAVLFIIAAIVLAAKAFYRVNELRKESSKYWALRNKHGES